MNDALSVLGAISPLIALAAGWLAGQLKGNSKRSQALEDGVKMLLRSKIIDKCLHYIQAGSIPPYALETIKGLFASYLALGDGDRSVADLVERVERLQIRSG